MLKTKPTKTETKKNPRLLSTKLKNKTEEIKSLKKQNKIKSDFLSMIAHDLRTPLHTVMLMTDHLLIDEKKDARVDLLKSIYRSSEQMLVIVNDILDLNRAKAGKLTITENLFSLPILLNEINNEFQLRAEEKKLSFKTEYHSKSDWLIGDSTRLRQIIYNLCDNAIKYTKKGSVKLLISDGKTRKKNHLALAIKVIDTGLGIPNNKRKKIFDHFTQLQTKGHQEHTKQQGGVGLGLAIVQYWVKALGAKLSLESKLKEGTTFTCEFYFKSPPLDMIKAAESANRKMKSTSTKKISKLKKPAHDIKASILLVEDNPLSQKAVIFLLNRYGCTVDLASDGEDALNKMLSTTYDLVLMDERLPDTYGHKIIAKYLKKTTQIKKPLLVALTAEQDKSTENKYKKAGVNGLLHKPLTSDKLIVWLKKIKK